MEHVTLYIRSPNVLSHWHCLTHRLPRHRAGHFVNLVSQTFCPDKCRPLACLTYRLLRHGACHFVQSVPRTFCHEKFRAIGTVLPIVNPETEHSVCTFSPQTFGSEKCWPLALSSSTQSRSMSLCTLGPQTFCPEIFRPLAPSYPSSTQARSMSFCTFVPQTFCPKQLRPLALSYQGGTEHVSLYLQSQTFCPEKCCPLALSYPSSTQARSMSHSVPERFVPKNVGHWHSIHHLPRHGACYFVHLVPKHFVLKISSICTVFVPTRHGASQFVYSVTKRFVLNNFGHWHCLTHRLPRHEACHFVC
jgi:hypothetical protein